MNQVAQLERAGATSALERCTGDARRFLETTWGRRAAIHSGVEPNGFGDLLSFDDVDRILSTTALRTPAFRLVKAGERIPESAYTRSGTTGSRPVSGMVDPARVAELFGSGATIVLQGLHRFWEPVAGFLRDLELELSHPCQVNAYVTPPGAQGLPLHDDPHDVFVLQAFGQKAWEVHAAPGEPEREPHRVVVGSGDAIYLPKGTRHAAATQESLSGHLTVGVHVESWRDLVAAAWRRVERDPSWEEPLPAGWARDAEGLAASLAERLREAGQRLRDLDAAEVVEAKAIEFLSTRPPLLRGVLVDRLELDRIDDGTVLERRPGSVCELARREERLLVLLGDRRLEMPAWLEAAMERIASQGSVRVADLADVVPERESRLVLARRLVREGLLRPGR